MVSAFTFPYLVVCIILRLALLRQTASHKLMIAKIDVLN